MTMPTYMLSDILFLKALAISRTVGVIPCTYDIIEFVALRAK